MPQSKNKQCNLCSEVLSTPYALGRHLNEVHGLNQIRYKCSTCDHESKRPSDLKKHERAKHRTSAFAKPKGNKRRRESHLLKSRYGQQLMAEAISAALKKKKRKRPVISSDEEDPTPSAPTTSTMTSSAYTEDNPDCRVVILPPAPTPEMYNELPPLGRGLANTIASVEGLGTVLKIDNYENIFFYPCDSPIY